MAKSKGAAFCIIYSRASDRFLMELRGNDVGNPGQYGFFGGGIDAGESKVAAIIRELQEETGFRVKSFDYVTCLSKKSNVYLFVKIIEKEFKPKLSWESADYRWVKDLDEAQPLHKKLERSYGMIRRLMRATRDAVNNEEA